ncbi:zinc-dependent alcohol dehydrogenase family protein [Agrobacterium rubi]|uniref:Zinc-dependent alcohol dehydrogenase family protein n=2 Tax=Rhizobium/Agrobacterium group TaxID=227290 RepID=A0AAE7US51_9HYPH|nr:zinc-dependent alcohol dehydrogenase family protein [Agrobacterium rosae]NTE89807.1 zinc-dependent alcohol dehydrogenase family protein [Agrobacterium rubi]NTF05343.1 zinc-dependent alcohol dehydrogenase family protein [Agrobacterium rubi]NTF10502.1 zinc-dependent alcohol dehydrogenase family protein [Agrobacterium rubi]NTF22896.1 zinc-dependent alcohol dehydrogenase family protein [Agrobacterium rubi]
MRALLLDTYDSGTFVERELPKPVAQRGELLIRIAASGLNPIDTKIKAGAAPYAMPELPAVLGTDMAGTVEAVGEGVSGFAVGDEVYGLTGGVRGLQGSLAQFVAVDAALVALKPSNLSLVEAATLPLVALTAWEGLVDRAKVQPGQTVLVQGGAGGVGHIVIQLARALGANVFATASSAKQDILRELGATPIDYNATTVDEYVALHTGGEGFDVVYDTVGGTALDASLIATKHYGHVASCAAFGDHNFAGAALRCVTLSGVFVLLPMLSGRGRAHHGEVLKQIAELVETGKVHPLLDGQVFEFAEAERAYEAQASGSVTGKTMIKIA